MISVILGAILGLCFFMFPALMYREGIRVGMQINKGIEPPALQSPIQVIKEIPKVVRDIKQEHEQAKADKKLDKDLETMFNYNGGDTDDG